MIKKGSRSSLKKWSKKDIEKLKPFWSMHEKFQDIVCSFYQYLDAKMQMETGLDVEFFWGDEGVILGIGDKEFPHKKDLLQETDLKDEIKTSKA